MEKAIDYKVKWKDTQQFCLDCFELTRLVEWLIKNKAANPKDIVITVHEREITE
jgi:hypothetical protein